MTVEPERMPLSPLEQAEIRKLEAEARAIERTFHLPWFRSEWFLGVVKAAVAGLVAVPLMWFFYQEIAVKVLETDAIDAKLQYAKDQKALAAERDQLARERDELLKKTTRVETVDQELAKERERLEKLELELRASQKSLTQLTEELQLTKEQSDKLVMRANEYAQEADERAAERAKEMRSRLEREGMALHECVTDLKHYEAQIKTLMDHLEKPIEGLLSVN